MEDNKFLWEGNTASGEPVTVAFEQIVDPIDPDGDPDVRIVLTGKTVHKLVLPANALLAFVADLIRDARIDELREMADDEVLGLPELDDYEDVEN